MKEVTPKTYLIGCTGIAFESSDHGLWQYLCDTGNERFYDDYIKQARNDGLSDGEILCSFYAKLCYKALCVGDNPNITKTRDIKSNLEACFNAGHGSVFEHCWLNFVTTDCSRVFTHELVRHRIGTAFSQTSGRYVRLDSENDMEMVIDPILEPVKYVINEIMDDLKRAYHTCVALLGIENIKDFDKKKKLTSALRRMLPNGQANEIGWSVNIRALRHLVMMRTSRHAEWEIRLVFNQVYDLIKAKFPLMFYGAQETSVDGLLEISGMKMQPYEEAT
ncbi:hypothetical protein LCGC14_0392110 [marine sediment metagenome]|uniref:Thymidylate synthase (FAD) n=1 Tax=marine sediment metagenome TaxID=412755 RepID=A0A0F9THB5_9ZZZZ